MRSTGRSRRSGSGHVGALEGDAGRIANARGTLWVWREVRRVLRENTGLPHLGGRRRPVSRLYTGFSLQESYLPMIFWYMRSRRSVLASQHACALFALSRAC